MRFIGILILFVGFAPLIIILIKGNAQIKKQNEGSRERVKLFNEKISNLPDSDLHSLIQRLEPLNAKQRYKLLINENFITDGGPEVYRVADTRFMQLIEERNKRNNYVPDPVDVFEKPDAKKLLFGVFARMANNHSINVWGLRIAYIALIIVLFALALAFPDALGYSYHNGRKTPVMSSIYGIPIMIYFFSAMFYKNSINRNR